MQNLATYLYEIGQLKQVRRSGWWLAGITNPESVAEHSFRTAMIGYLLASLEGVDASRVALLCLFHDTHETRIQDLHRVAKRYIATDNAERDAFAEQNTRLPQAIATNLAALMDDYEKDGSPEAVVAHDADLLECLMQACEYQARGYPDVADWIVNCQAGLRTQSAQQLAQACIETEPKAWWQGLKQSRS